MRFRDQNRRVKGRLACNVVSAVKSPGIGEFDGWFL